MNKSQSYHFDLGLILVIWRDKQKGHGSSSRCLRFKIGCQFYYGAVHMFKIFYTTYKEEMCVNPNNLITSVTSPHDKGGETQDVFIVI